jgi:hypothetical protein
VAVPVGLWIETKFECVLTTEWIVCDWNSVDGDAGGVEGDEGVGDDFGFFEDDFVVVVMVDDLDCAGDGDEGADGRVIGANDVEGGLGGVGGGGRA